MWRVCWKNWMRLQGFGSLFVHSAVRRWPGGSKKRDQTRNTCFKTHSFQSLSINWTYCSLEIIKKELQMDECKWLTDGLNWTKCKWHMKENWWGTGDGGSAENWVLPFANFQLLTYYTNSTKIELVFR